MIKWAGTLCRLTCNETSYYYNCSSVLDRWRLGHNKDHFAPWKKEQPLSMPIENKGLMHQCFPGHLHMGTARMKYYKDTVEEGKKRRMNM